MADNYSLGEAISESPKYRDFSNTYLQIGRDFQRQKVDEQKRQDAELYKLNKDFLIDKNIEPIFQGEMAKTVSDGMQKIYDARTQDPNNKLGQQKLQQELYLKAQETASKSARMKESMKSLAAAATPESAQLLEEIGKADIKDPAAYQKFLQSDAVKNAQKNGWISVGQNGDIAARKAPAYVDIGTNIQNKTKNILAGMAPVVDYLKTIGAGQQIIQEAKYLPETEADRDRLVQDLIKSGLSAEAAALKVPLSKETLLASEFQDSKVAARHEYDIRNNDEAKKDPKAFFDKTYGSLIPSQIKTDIRAVPSATGTDDSNSKYAWTKTPTMSFQSIQGTQRGNDVIEDFSNVYVIKPKLQGTGEKGTHFNIVEGTRMDNGEKVKGDIPVADMYVATSTLDGKKYVVMNVPKLKKGQTTTNASSLDKKFDAYDTETRYDWNDTYNVKVPYNDAMAAQIEATTKDKKNPGFVYPEGVNPTDNKQKGMVDKKTTSAAPQKTAPKADGSTQRFTVDGIDYDIPADKVVAFKKAMRLK